MRIPVPPGGILVDTLSWPWIFFVDVPVGILTFVRSLRLVPESRDEHMHRSFDVAGAVTVTGGLIALVYEPGLGFLPFTAGIIIGSVGSQKLVPALGARETPVVGLALAVLGRLLFLRLTSDSSYLVARSGSRRSRRSLRTEPPIRSRPRVTGRRRPRRRTPCSTLPGAWIGSAVLLGAGGLLLLALLGRRDGRAVSHGETRSAGRRLTCA
ncbi:MAG: hypothetical protein ACR2HI_01090 [Gaiella sp.]